MSKNRKGGPGEAAQSGLARGVATHPRYSSHETKRQPSFEDWQPFSEEEFVALLQAKGVTREEHSAAADATSEADRIWFEQHPGVNERIRPMSLDEIMHTWVPPGWVVTGGVTRVTQIVPGARYRQQLEIFREPIGRPQ
jgi:hypothetical protein